MSLKDKIIAFVVIGSLLVMLFLLKNMRMESQELVLLEKFMILIRLLN
jgi:hypothetical protein